MRNARALVVGVAAAAALVSTYPLLFGRSGASPLLGGVAMLYRDAPYTPGNPSGTLENPRAIDMLSPLVEALPYLAIERAALQHGEWPHWNRYSALGTPLHGQGQPSLLDPLHLLALIPRNPAAGIDLKIVAGRLIFAIGAALLGLAVAGTRGGVVLGATTPFLGVFLHRLAHPAQFSLVYVPWLLLGYVWLSRHGAPRMVGPALLVWGATAVTITGSPAKEAVAQLAVAHAVGTMTLLLSRGKAAGRTLGLIAMGLLLVACLTAPHWLIFLDTLSRAQTLYDAPTITFAGWRDVLGLVLGPVMPGMPTASLNALAVVLAVAALLPHSSSVRPPMVAAAAGTSILVLGWGLGSLPESWLLLVPGVGRLQRIGSLAFVAALVPLLVLAAHGVEEIHQRRRVAIAGALVLLLCAVATWQLNALLALSPAMSLFAAFTVVMAAMLLALASSKNRIVRAFVIASAVVIVLLPGGLHLRTGIEHVDRLLMQPPPRPDYTQPSPALRRWLDARHEPSRVAGLDGMLRGGSQALYGLEAVLSQDALVTPGLDQLMRQLPIDWQPHSWDRRLQEKDLARLDPVFDMLGVSQLLLPPESTLGSPAADEPMRVATRSSAWPRAFFVSNAAMHVDTAQFLDRLAVTRRPFASISAVDSEAMRLPAPATGASDYLPASDYRLTPNRTTFRVRAPAAGVVVLMEAWVAHDFEARLNGAVVPYFKVNEVAKAIVVPAAGEWDVSFEYRPRWWRLACWIAIGGALGIAVLATIQLRR